VQKPTVPYVVEFAAIFDDGPLGYKVTRFARGQIGGQIHDAIAAFEISLMPDEDLVLLRDSLCRDIPDFHNPSLPDCSHDSPFGKCELDIAAPAWK
jgi:hypothetical protein